VEKHFREVHSPNIIRRVGTHTARTPAAREALPPPLRRLARREFDLQQRFPLKLVTRLADDFAHRGLHFFKVNRTVLHVSVARPRYLDFDTNPVSDGVRKIMESIRGTPKCTRRKLLESLGIHLPDPAGAASAPAPAVAPAPAPPVAAATEAPAVEGESGEAVATEQTEQAAGSAAAPAPEAPVQEAAAPISPELQAIITDLHWLIHEGHVIEYSSGIIEAAKKPAPRPQPAPRPAPVRASAPPVAGDATSSEGEAQGEGESEGGAEVADQAIGTVSEGAEAIEGSDATGPSAEATQEATEEVSEPASSETPAPEASAPPVAGDAEASDDALRSNPS
jgi:hypothetical protein